MRSRLASIAFGAALIILLGQSAWGESYPELEQLVPRCVLIAHCRTADFEGRVIYKVEGIWKGEYSPLAFAVMPPTGYILAPTVEQAVDKDVILFYTSYNQPPDGKLERPDMQLLVRNGHIVYPPESKLGGGHKYSLDEFKTKIANIVENTGGLVEDAIVVPKHETPDLSGSWRVFLPAGFEHELTLTRLDNNRYRVEPLGFTFSGVYELRDRALTIVEPSDPRLQGFTWEMRSNYLLTLTSQAENTGADYLGAILFRAQDSSSAVQQR